MATQEADRRTEEINGLRFIRAQLVEVVEEALKLAGCGSFGMGRLHEHLTSALFRVSSMLNRLEGE